MKKLIIILFAAVLLSGCSKDSSSASSSNGNQGGGGNNSPIVGTWSKPAYEYEGKMRRDEAYYFMNENTVVKLGTCYNQPYVTYWNGSPFLSFETPVPTHSDWYYKGGFVTITYLFEDNKIGMTDGTIFTYMNGKLYKDNSSIVLEKW